MEARNTASMCRKLWVLKTVSVISAKEVQNWLLSNPRGSSTSMCSKDRQGMKQTTSCDSQALAQLLARQNTVT
uniref:Uncharacterized protein n=1 Tax=Steinernema glaseri TaxID=37863 RepID=A0A1I7YLQ1_9BILA